MACKNFKSLKNDLIMLKNAKKNFKHKNNNKFIEI